MTKFSENIKILISNKKRRGLILFARPKSQEETFNIPFPFEIDFKYKKLDF